MGRTILAAALLIALAAAAHATPPKGEADLLAGPKDRPEVVCGAGYVASGAGSCVPVPVCPQGYTQRNPDTGLFEPLCECPGSATAYDHATQKARSFNPFSFDPRTGRCADVRRARPSR